ncbi:Paraquat-inducible protein A [Pseudoalteromonas sp. NBT06-2]|uniref:paraquat-inducible protein A n=1 Tax=Pseudoalteromonas sp. NBT06-2 TaxID=2025950 RepID=UPI000BA6C0A6|nr:paraquat-inducible protein A [Pseudoalteromonas sp. NBT06-2]PAJ72235.1 Paraquat-inducible protein A [Pseudoalteromonas sp. NBT06-2]
MIKKHIGFVLNIAAILLFIPGIILPMFTLNMDMAVNVANTSLSSDLVNKKLSLIQTIQELYQDDRIVVTVLLSLFSIGIPIIKSLSVSFAYFIRNTQLEYKIYDFVSKIGKWSMADVFVIAVFLAVLSTNHAETASNQQIVVFGFKMELLISSQTLSAVGQGFYYFVGYCLLSLLATQISLSSFNCKKLSQDIDSHELDKSHS